MAHVVADRVRETSSSTGTGSLTLSGAVVGFRTFASAPMVVGDTCHYAATMGTSWEIGIGTLTGGSTLARTAVLSSSNGGSPINFATGVKDIALVIPALLGSLLAGLADGSGQPFVDNVRLAINAAVPGTPASGLRMRGRTLGSFDSLAVVGADGAVSYLNPSVSLISQGRVLPTAPAGFADISLPADFEGYELEIAHYTPATSGEDLRLRVSIDGGATYLAGTNYSFGNATDASDGTAGSLGETGVSYFAIVRNQQNGAGVGGAYARVRLWQPTTGSTRVAAMWESISLISTGLRRSIRGGGYVINATSRATHVRLIPSLGNIGQIVYRLSGMQRLLGL